MNWDWQTILKALVAIAVGGIILLAITYLTPLFFIVGIAVVGYLIYRYFKTGKIGF